MPGPAQQPSFHEINNQGQALESYGKLFQKVMKSYEKL